MWGGDNNGSRVQSPRVQSLSPKKKIRYIYDGQFASLNYVIMSLFRNLGRGVEVPLNE